MSESKTSGFQVIATLNTHLLTPEWLEGMAKHGATILRVNGSHVLPEELPRYSEAVRKALGQKAKLLVDLPGNKIRTAVLPQAIVLSAGKTFELGAHQVNYREFFKHLKTDDILLANDSLFKFRVVSADAERAVLHSYTDGQLTSNKGVHLTNRPLPLPFLFERDRLLIEQAKKSGFDYVGLSFVRTAQDVEQAREAVRGSTLALMVKVETAAALQNLDAILEKAEEFLVDRGDLSCDVGIENVDYYQKLILKRAKRAGKRVYFATQFLHSMLHNNVPLIAEACGLTDVIASGVDGVQLSEETAVGKYPLEVLATVQRIRTAAANVDPLKVSSEARPAPVFWLTGLSGSGKTTLCRELVAALKTKGFNPCWIDGDDFRGFWGNDVGYTKQDRFMNLRNMIFTAYQASRSFDLVIVSSLSPYRELRALAREKNPSFHEIYVECSAETCAKRDPKGHYKKASQGEHKNFIGITEEYEVPANPDLTVNTDQLGQGAAVEKLLNYVLAP